MRRKKRNRKPTPFRVVEPSERDPRVPELLWGLPRRIELANLAGPKYNQTDLATNAGLVQSVISKLANWGNLYGIRLETLYKLSAALNVSVPWLLGETRTRRRRTPTKGKSR